MTFLFFCFLLQLAKDIVRIVDSKLEGGAYVLHITCALDSHHMHLGLALVVLLLVWRHARFRLLHINVGKNAQQLVCAFGLQSS